MIWLLYYFFLTGNNNNEVRPCITTSISKSKLTDEDDSDRSLPGYFSDTIFTLKIQQEVNIYFISV